MNWMIVKGPQTALFGGDCMLCLGRITPGQKISLLQKKSSIKVEYWVHTSCADRYENLERIPLYVEKAYTLRLPRDKAEQLTQDVLQEAVDLWLPGQNRIKLKNPVELGEGQIAFRGQQGKLVILTRAIQKFLDKNTPII